MKERKKLLQIHDLCTKEKVHIMKFSDVENVDIMDFSEWKEIFLNAGSWNAGRFFLSIYEACMII